MTIFIGAFLCALAFTVLLVWAELPLLKKLNAKQQILGYVTEHSAKEGTPTMGGIAFLLSVTACALLFCKHNKPLYLFVAVFVGYGVVGFLDDFIKVRLKRNQGLTALQKIAFQLAVAVIVAVFVYNEPSVADTVVVPFCDKAVQIGKWFVPLAVFVFLACTNGVNLTDGLDGLATTTTVAFLSAMAVLIWQQQRQLLLVGDTLGANQCQNVLTLCFVSLGALVGFLLFNCFPAKVFMGDTGSLALGALVACVTIFTRLTLFLPIVGVMYVVSCLSVIVQVAYFKITKGKRVFLMAPYHHHLQKRGLSETRISVIYGTVTLAVGLILALCRQ